MARLILMRHGESEANITGCYALSDEDRLTPRGEQQAHDSAQRIALIFKPVVVISSPFMRARQTGAIIARELHVGMEIAERLQERDFGEFKGQPYAKLEAQAKAPKWLWRPNGGESNEDVCRRVVPALQQVCSSHANDNIVVVSHAAAIFCLWMHISGDMGLWKHTGTLPNTSMILMEHHSGKFYKPIMLSA